jgi:lipoyl(octanoyl) transferase
LKTPIARSRKPSLPKLEFSFLGQVDFVQTDEQMRAHWLTEGGQAKDHVWFLEHPPVYSLGYRSKIDTFRTEVTAPVVRTDRGGEVTYHGPGQLVCYLLFDLKRRGIGVRQFVERVEQVVIQTLASFAISGHRRSGMPGVYIDDAKVASIGLKVRNGCTTHGISINYAVDLSAFDSIHPCGYEGLKMVNVSDHIEAFSLDEFIESLKSHFVKEFCPPE